MRTVARLSVAFSVMTALAPGSAPSAMASSGAEWEPVRSARLRGLHEVEALRSISSDRSLASEVAQAAVAFAPHQAIPVGSNPESVAIGDVTGDGRADVVMSTGYYFDELNDFKLFVFAQNTDGSLASPTKLATDGVYGDSMGVAAGDVDGDNDIDVALATTGGIDLFKQAGGALGAASLVPTTSPMDQVEIADIDGDSDNDIVAVGDGGISILESNAGSFTEALVTAQFYREIEVADVTTDGLLDIVGVGTGTVDVLVQQVGGTFAVPAPHALGGVSGVATGDVNGDGRIDVIATSGGNRPASEVNVFLQSATGTLAAAVDYPVYDIPEPVEAADVDGDGRTDVVTAHGGWNAVGVLTQNASGTLDAETRYAVPSASHYNEKGLAVGDINSDGNPDIVLADSNNGLVVLRQGSATVNPTSVALSLSRTRVPYGKRVTITAKLTAPGGGQTLSIYATPYGGSKLLLKNGQVNSESKLSVTVRPARRTAFVAEFAATPTLEGSRSSTKNVLVRARTISRLRRHYGTSGRYKLYHAGTRPLQVCGVAPDHTGSTVTFIAQVNLSNWTTTATKTFTLGPGSVIGAKLRGTRQGYDFRMRCVFGGSASNLADSSPWRYFRITA